MGDDKLTRRADKNAVFEKCLVLCWMTADRIEHLGWIVWVLACLSSELCSSHSTPIETTGLKVYSPSDILQSYETKKRE